MRPSTIVKLVFACGAGFGPQVADAQTTDWREGLNPASGYTASQVRALHALFDLADWQTTADADCARYPLQNMTELFPHAVIRRAGPVRPLPSEPRSDIGEIVATTQGHGRLALEGFLAASQTDAFIVVHEGSVVYERYPRMRPTGAHLFWSISKTFPSLLIAQLEAEGRVDVHAPVETFIPELADTAWHGTPVIDILDQASGMNALENDEPDTWDRPELAVFQYESSLGLLRRTPAADLSTYDIVASIGRLRPSGERFEYLSVNTFVLGWLVESVTGKPFAEAVSERIWSRIGAEFDASIVVAPGTGAAASHGGISATLRDLARYGMQYTPSGEGIARERVVPEGYADKLLAGGRPELVERAGPGSKAITRAWEDPARHETYQWDAVWPDGDFFKAGFRGQGLYVSPSRDLIVAFFSTTDQGLRNYARAIARSEIFEPRGVSVASPAEGGAPPR